MKNIRRRFELFCMRNRDKGIPNLMLYLAIGTAVVYLFSDFLGNDMLYKLLVFDRDLILRGQIWRLVTYPLTYRTGNILLMAVSLFVYYSLGRVIEQVWGSMRFTLFYFTGVVLMDLFCLLFRNVQADVYYLNLSLFLSYATLFPDAQFLLFFIIPVKAWIFGIVYLAMVLPDLFRFPFPYNLFSVVSLANYFLFFGKDVLNLIPRSWRMWLSRKLGMSSGNHAPKAIPFTPGPRSTPSAARPNYTHKCTVCGRTDQSDPDLEFRYCSRCRGYYCYCEDHISNHTHIQS